ncbi:MAG: hypothetical protein OHK0037_23750 [Elainellaceae cyanobacterium]
MNTTWKRLLQKTAIWLLVEVTMNLTGLDTLADFSEFLFDMRPVALQIQPSQFSLKS